VPLAIRTRARGAHGPIGRGTRLSESTAGAAAASSINSSDPSTPLTRNQLRASRAWKFSVPVFLAAPIFDKAASGKNHAVRGRAAEHALKRARPVRQDARRASSSLGQGTGDVS
jgi:hypothetical protein